MFDDDEIFHDGICLLCGRVAKEEPVDGLYDDCYLVCDCEETVKYSKVCAEFDRFTEIMVNRKRLLVLTKKQRDINSEMETLEKNLK